MADLILELIPGASIVLRLATDWFRLTLDF